MSCSEKPELIVRECANGSIELPHEVLKDAAKDLYAETIVSDRPKDGKAILTMHVEDIIKHLSKTYLEEK